MFRKLLRYYKYRHFSFKKEGVGCDYKSMKSIFINPKNIELGDYVNLGPGSELDGAGSIVIGTGVIFAPEVCVYSRTHNFNSEDLSAIPFDNKVLISKVVIEDYVWIGRKAIILPGVTIGMGAVVGAGAVVSKNIPKYGIAVGNPAKIVKYRDEIVFQKILKSKSPFVYNKHGRSKIFISK
jgi:acetyltransferase-like isoleucine patch superfamily enzyme